MARAGVIALWVLLLSACWTGADSGHQRRRPIPEANRVEFTGTIVFVPLEGGFYGIVSEEGKRYDPLRKLPVAFQKNGLKVRVVGLLPGKTAGFHMWGEKIRILKIEPRFPGRKIEN